MLLEEIESENEDDSSSVVLRSSVATFSTERPNGGSSPASPSLAGKQANRLSIPDYRRINKVVSNVRTSVHDYNIFRQFKKRNVTDIINAEVDLKQ